jgi:hypothetical protein
LEVVSLDCSFPREEEDMSFGIYAVGFAIFIAGLAYVAHLMHMPTQWIGAGVVILVGLGILSAVKATRQKDPAN